MLEKPIYPNPADQSLPIAVVSIATMMLRRSTRIQQQMRLQEALVQPVEQITRILARGVEDRIERSSRGHVSGLVSRRALSCASGWVRVVGVDFGRGSWLWGAAG